MLANQKQMYLYPLPVRVWHWLNAACFIVLIFTGFQIRYAELFNLLTLSTAIAVHNYVGFVVIANFFIWLAYYLVSGKVKSYIPDQRSFPSLILRQLHYYGYGIFMGKPSPHVISPENKFNPLQQLVYLVLMFVLLPAQMMSGLFLWQIKKYEEYINLLGGIKLLDTIHVLLFFFFTSYLVVHCYLATLGHTPLARFKAMISGYVEQCE
jgi:Ni/Fe-hydrogenase b-type cytochrome subunit